MLLAGAGATDTPAICGALTFTVNNSPSYAWWTDGSAKNNQYRASTLYTGLSRRKEYVK